MTGSWIANKKKKLMPDMLLQHLLEEDMFDGYVSMNRKGN